MLAIFEKVFPIWNLWKDFFSDRPHSCGKRGGKGKEACDTLLVLKFHWVSASVSRLLFLFSRRKLRVSHTRNILAFFLQKSKKACLCQENWQFGISTTEISGIFLMFFSSCPNSDVCYVSGWNALLRLTALSPVQRKVRKRCQLEICQRKKSKHQNSIEKAHFFPNKYLYLFLIDFF